MNASKNTLLSAVADLFWTFFPVFILVGVLALLGRLTHLAERTDLILCAALLFAEGWSRLRKLPVRTHAAAEFWGVMGALVTVVLAAVMLLVEAGGITQLQPIVTSARFVFVHYLMLTLSVLFGLWVRVIVSWQEQIWRSG